MIRFITPIMMEIKKGSLDERAIKILLDKYPITVSELRQELGISKSAVNRLIKSFIARGIIKLDKLPDKEFILLQKHEFRFIGHHESQRKPLKIIKRRDRKAKYLRKKELDEYDNIMYQ